MYWLPLLIADCVVLLQCAYAKHSLLLSPNMSQQTDRQPALYMLMHLKSTKDVPDDLSVLVTFCR